MHRRYVYRPNPETGEVEAVEVSADYQRHAERAPLFGDSYMDGTRSPIDGTDIGSRTKRREHMRLHGLVDADDYKGTWEQAAKQREAIRTGAIDRNERREAIGRALERKR